MAVLSLRNVIQAKPKQNPWSLTCQCTLSIQVWPWLGVKSHSDYLHSSSVRTVGTTGTYEDVLMALSYCGDIEITITASLSVNTLNNEVADKSEMELFSEKIDQLKGVCCETVCSPQSHEQQHYISATICLIPVPGQCHREMG